MFAENSTTLNFRESFFKHFPNGRGRTPPVLSPNDAQCASCPAAPQQVLTKPFPPSFWSKPATQKPKKQTWDSVIDVVMYLKSKTS